MGNIRLTGVKLFLLFGCFSCSEQKSFDSQSVFNSSWSFELTSSGAQLLSDSEEHSVLQLSGRIQELIRGQFRFRDPVSRMPFVPSSLPSVGGRFWQSSGSNSRSWEWQAQLPEQVGLRWGQCKTASPLSLVINCETQQILECLHVRSESELHLEEGEERRSSPNRSLLLSWLRECGLSGDFRAEFSDSATFSRQSGRLIFEPSPLLSLQIYKGSWQSYEQAVVNSVAAAGISAVTPCPRSDGACVVSPVDENECEGCSQLEKGSIYTVFFLEGLRQDYATVQSALFVP
jgi:hypothetical protein